jgi:hypothetical protein
MVSTTIKLLIGVLALVLGALIGVAGLSFGVTTCVNTGTATSCTTNQSAQLIALLFVLSGISVFGIGGRTVWKAV